MKPHRILSQSISSLLLLSALGTGPALHAANLWDGGGTTDNWSDILNWDNDLFPGYGTLTFAGSTRTTNIVDANISMNQLLWTGTSAWTLNNAGGAVISLFDNGGVQAKVENQSTGLVTINAPVTFAATAGAAWGEINAVNGDLTFGSGGTLTVNGSAVAGIKMFGAGRTTTFNSTVSAAGKWFATTAAADVIAVGGAFTSGDIYVMNGSTLKLNSGGSITTSGLRLGGDFGTTLTQNLAQGATFQLTNLTGGQSMAGNINSVTGNTSNALLVDSQNTSGTNTLSGSVFLDAPLTFQQAAGGTLALTGVVSNASSLTKTGAGALTLSGLNTFTGGLTLSAGTLNFNNAAAAGNTATGAITITGGTLDNTSGGALTTTTAKAMTWNGNFTFTGTNNLSTNLGAVTISTATRTANIAGGVLTTGLINSAAGIGLTKTGAGTLFMANTANTSNIGGTLDVQAGKVQVAGDFTVGGLTGSGTVENGGAASKWFFVNNAADNTFSGTIQNNPSSPTTIRLGLVKSGAGNLTLSGTNNFADNFDIRNGTVTITGTSSTGYTGGGQTKVGSVANTNGILVINGGTLNANMTTSPSLYVGGGANTRGFLKMTSGTINTTNQFNIGTGSVATTTRAYGAFTMSGGTLNSGSWLVVGANFDRAVLNQSGGTINVLANRMTIGAGGLESLGVVNVSGTGTLNSTGGIFLGENGQGIVNLSGTGTLNTGTNSMQFAGNAASTFGTLNLNGGTLATGTLTKGTSNAAGVYRINFNGGTVKANASSATFLANLALTTGYVNSGGAIFDTNGFDDTVAMPLLTPLLTPTSMGLSALAVATGGAGYIDTPVITITGGTGTGAQAVANVSGGVVTGFTITNPGVGYTAGDVLTPVLFGGGSTTAATAGAITLAANASGGLTKNGAGNLTLSGASSYTGNVLVSAGTLTGNLTNIANPITSAFGNATLGGRTITVASGATLALTANDSFGNQAAVAANLPSVIVNGGTFRTTRYNQIGALTLNGATLTSSNTTDSGNYQNFQFLGNVTVTGSAPSFISATGAANFDSDHLFTNTNFIVADVTGNANSDLLVSAPLRDQSGNYGLAAGGFTKTGAGTMELSGTSTYTGATAVTNGTLRLTGTGAANSTSGLTVNGAGAKLLHTSSTAITPAVTLTSGTVDGTGTITTVNVAGLSTNVIANGNGTAGAALTIGTLSFAGAAKVSLLLNSTSAGLATTTLTAGGAASSVTIDASNTGWTNGSTYDLISYTGGVIGGTGFSAFIKGLITGIGARQSATLGDSGTAITLGIAGDLPVWTGLQTGAWTTNIVGGSSNWRLQTATTATDFLTNDTVLFADTIPGGGAPGTATVDITGASGVVPISTTFTNSAVAYTVTATGGSGITTGSLTKSGTAALTLGGTHSYTGATTLNNGTLNLTGSLGNTAVTVAAPATLSVQAAGAITQNTVTVNGTLAQTVANALGGTAALVLNNGATLSFANTYSGGTTLNTGALNIGHATAIGSGPLTISGGTVDNTSGLSLTLTNNNAQVWSSGAALAFTGTNALNMGTGAVTLGTDATTGTFQITNNSGLVGTSLTIGGPVTAVVGGAPGAKTLNLTGSDTALTGSITKGAATSLVINNNLAGTLTLSGAASNITTLNLNSGGTVELGAGNLGLGNGGGSILQTTLGGTLNGTGGGAIVLNSANGDFGTAGGTTLIVNAKITGANGVDFWNANGGAGFGTIVLNNANTSTGGVNIQNTQVVLTATGAINALNTANSGAVNVADVAATAELDITGGTINATRTAAPGFAVGLANGSNGTVNMTAGTINTTSELWLANSVGSQAVFNMSGGSVNTGNWFVVGRNFGTGTLNLSGGTIAKGAANYVIIGSLAGTGTLNQSGGALNTAGGGVRLGENSGATPALGALWDMTGGTSAITGEINIAWRSSQAKWNVSGASTTVTATGRLIVGAETSNAGATGGAVSGGNPVGTVNISGGSVTISGTDSRIGGDVITTSTGASGTVNVSGGTLNFGNNIQVGAYGLGSMTVSGSGVVNSTGGFPSVGRFASGRGVLTVSGGTLSQTAPAGFLIVGEEGNGTLNLLSGAVNSVALRIGHAAGGNGTVNLDGGTLTTSAVSQLNGAGALNFNGGTLKASAASATFLTGLTSAYVNASGAVIDSNTFGLTVGQALLAPTGSGVSAVSFTGGSGYTGTPLVVITGDGTGATGVATVDNSGNLTGIIITNPGINYTTATATLSGGGGSGAAFNTATVTANISGGLTKVGNGVLSLTGVNTYTGQTTVNAGTLQLGGSGVIADTSRVALPVSGAIFDANSQTETVGSLQGLAGTSVTLGSGTLTVGADGTSSTYSGAISGTGTLVKTGGGTFTLNGTQTYAALITNGGVTNVNSPLGTGTSTVNANATTNFNTSQTLASLTIADGVEVTFGDGLPFADEGGKFGAPALVPEPGSLGLLMVGALGLLGRRRRK